MKKKCLLITNIKWRDDKFQSQKKREINIEMSYIKEKKKQKGIEKNDQKTRKQDRRYSDPKARNS